MVPEGMNFIPLLPPPCSSATSASPCETRSVSVSQPVTPRPGLAEQARAVAAQMTLLPLEQRSSVPWTPPTPQPPKSPSTQPPFRPSRLQAPQSLQVAPHPPFHPAMGQVQQIMAHTPSGRAFPQWRMPQFAANAPLAYPGSSYSVPGQPLLAQQPAAPQMLSTFPQQQVWPQRQQRRFGEAQSVMPAPPPAHLRPPPGLPPRGFPSGFQPSQLTLLPTSRPGSASASLRMDQRATSRPGSATSHLQPDPGITVKARGGRASSRVAPLAVQASSPRSLQSWE